MRAENVALNLLRFVAAFLVVVGHVRQMFVVDYSQVAASPLTMAEYLLTSLASPAVMVFFVLSGYWVGGAALAGFRSGTFAWQNYIASRLVRLWLVLVPAIALTAIADVVGAHVWGSAAVYTDATGYDPLGGLVPTHSMSQLFGSVFFLTDLHPSLTRVLPFGSNHPLWSLGYEASYYLFFPLILEVVWRGRSIPRRAAAAVVLAAAAFVGGPAVLSLFPVWLLGVAIALVAPRITVMLRGRAVLPWLQVGSAGLAVLLAALSRLVPLVGLAFVGVATVLVGVLATDIAASARVRSAFAHVARLGRSSYSLYATHLPLVTLLAAALVPARSQRWQPTPAAWGLVALICAAMVVFAIGFARLTEANTEALRRRILRRPSPGLPDRSIVPAGAQTP